MQVWHQLQLPDDFCTLAHWCLPCCRLVSPIRSKRFAGQVDRDRSQIEPGPQPSSRYNTNTITAMQRINHIYQRRLPMRVTVSFVLAILFRKILLSATSLHYDDEHEIILKSGMGVLRRSVFVPQHVEEGENEQRQVRDRQISTSSSITDYYYEEGESLDIEDDILGGTTTTSPKHVSGSSLTSSYRGGVSHLDSSNDEQPSSSHEEYFSTSTTGSTLKHPYKSSDEQPSDYYTSRKKSHSNKGDFFHGSSSHFQWKHFHFRPIHYIFGSFFTALFFFGGATFVTAYQVLEQPSGCYATTCRRAIRCYKCILSLFTKGLTYFLWGQNEQWEGFESCDTDFEEEDNLPRLRAGIGRALEREHIRSMNVQQQSTVKSTATLYSNKTKLNNTNNYTTGNGMLELSCK